MRIRVHLTSGFKFGSGERHVKMYTRYLFLILAAIWAITNNGCSSEVDLSVNNQEMGLQTHEFHTQAELNAASDDAGCPKQGDDFCDGILPTAQLGLQLIDSVCKNVDPFSGFCTKADGYDASAEKPVLASCALDGEGGAQCAVDTAPMTMIDMERRRSGASCGQWSQCWYEPMPRGCENWQEIFCCATIGVPYLDTCHEECGYNRRACCG